MKISKSRLEVALARQCKSLNNLRSNFAPTTLAKINNGGELQTKTVGRLAKLLKVDPSEIIEEAN